MEKRGVLQIINYGAGNVLACSCFSYLTISLRLIPDFVLIDLCRERETVTRFHHVWPRNATPCTGPRRHPCFS
jgi:hypothetical protein